MAHFWLYVIFVVAVEEQIKGDCRISYMFVFSAAIYPVMWLPRGQGKTGCLLHWYITHVIQCCINFFLSFCITLFTNTVNHLFNVFFCIRFLSIANNSIIVWLRYLLPYSYITLLQFCFITLCCISVLPYSVLLGARLLLAHVLLPPVTRVLGPRAVW